MIGQDLDIVRCIVDKAISLGGSTLELSKRLGLDAGVAIPLVDGYIVSISSAIGLVDSCNSLEDRKAMQILLETGLCIRVELQMLEMNIFDAVVYVNNKFGVIVLKIQKNYSKPDDEFIINKLFNGINIKATIDIKDKIDFVNKTYYIGALT